MRRILRFKKKIFAILAIVSLFSFMMPLGAFASDSSVTASKAPTVADDAENVAFGTIKIIATAGAVSEGDAVCIKMPDGVEFASEFEDTAVDEEGIESDMNQVIIPSIYDGDDNGITADDVTVVNMDEDEIKVTVDVEGDPSLDVVILIQLGDMVVDSADDGPVDATVDPSANSGFPGGTVTVANINSNGLVKLSLTGADTSNEDNILIDSDTDEPYADGRNFDFVLRMKEDVAGSFEFGEETMKAKLPSGYEWTTGDVNDLPFVALWGENILVDLEQDEEELIVHLEGVWIDEDEDGEYDAAVDTLEERATEEPSAWEGTWPFKVEDESKAKPGDVICAVSGESNFDAASAPVGTYGEESTTLSAKTVPTIVAGRVEQEIGDLVIKENMEGSLTQGKTVTVTLPEGVVFQEVYDCDIAGADDPADLGDFTTDEGLEVNFISYSNSDRTAKYTVAEESDDAAEIKLENIEVAIEAGFTGDLEIEVGGSAGATGKVVVAKVVGAVTAAATNATEVKIGLSDQIASDFTITENAAEAFIDDGTVTLDLPAGLSFVKTPKVEVTAGDVKISNIERAGNDNQVTFDVDSESTSASTISVSDVVLKLDRTVAEGTITLEVQNDGIVETDAYDDWTNSDTAAKVVIANVITPAPGEVKTQASFVIGSTTYKVAGVEKTMDVAPYVQDGRTFLPVRYVAEALGVTSENIIWDGATQKVTLLKGDKVVQMTIGSKIMIVNGVAITMDVPAAITSGRTMLPFRFIAQALGATVGWDEATQTVTLN